MCHALFTTPEELTKKTWLRHRARCWYEKTMRKLWENGADPLEQTLLDCDVLIYDRSVHSNGILNELSAHGWRIRNVCESVRNQITRSRSPDRSPISPDSVMICMKNKQYTHQSLVVWESFTKCIQKTHVTSSSVPHSSLNFSMASCGLDAFLVWENYEKAMRKL